MLKPKLARGDLHLVGAIRWMNTEFILRRMQPWLEFRSFSCPGPISKIHYLGLKEKYEVHHGVQILDNALIAAARLSHRYIADRKQPDKSIDLVDEAASRLRLQQERYGHHSLIPSH